MNLSIILYQPYPYGYACTNRIHYYAQAVNEMGGSASIYIPVPTEFNQDLAKNIEVKGCYKTVNFEYTSGTPIRPKLFFIRRLAFSLGIFKTAYRLIQNRKKMDAVLMVTNKSFPFLFIKLVTLFTGSKYILEKSELPFYNKPPKNIFDTIYQKFYITHIFKIFHGIIVISNPLTDFFQKRVSSKAHIITVPVIVDPEEFLEESNLKNEKYIAYCGNFTQSQDGVIHLIEGFSEISSEFPDLRLKMIGEPVNSENKTVIHNLINKLAIADKIDFLGYVSRDELVTNIKSAEALILAKPKSLQADYCFPSKLAEFLMSSTPVIVTDVGVIGDYLEDEVSAYIATPDSSDSVADKLVQVLTNKDTAKKVGVEGQKVALTHFAYKKQVERIVKFINELS